MKNNLKPGDKVMWGEQIVELATSWTSGITGNTYWQGTKNEASDSPLGIPESELKPLIKAKE